MYCVVLTDAGWQLALYVGKRKDVMPGVFRSVRAACRECDRLNEGVYEATGANVSHETMEVAV